MPERFKLLKRAQIGIVNCTDAVRLPRKVTAIIAGAAPTAHVIGALEKISNRAVHVYGLTETYGPTTRNYDQVAWQNLTLEERAKFTARQGHAFTNSDETRVVYQREDEVLIDTPRDGLTVGEIIMRGNIVMKNYFNDPDATKQATRGGYFRSGDLAVRFPDGSISIQDRSKDLIISGGENASSLAIEQELAEHPDVLEVSVVARPHEKWGERPMAFVLLQPQAEDKWHERHDAFEAELKQFARKRLPGFATPEWVSIVTELPKTSTGKIRKTELRKVAAKL